MHRRFLRGIWIVALGLVVGVSLAAAADIDGVYEAKGTTPDGKTYAGEVQIKSFGPTEGIAWRLGNDGYKGLGIVSGDVLGAAYSNQEGFFGVVVYEVRAGSLKGVWTDVSAQMRAGRENLEGPAGLDGIYKIVLGENASGSGNYTGQVVIKPNGKTYVVLWLDAKTSKPTAFGAGILVEDRLVVGYGSKLIPGVVGYKIDGATLNGVWTKGGAVKAQDATKLSISVDKETGTETLIHKP